MADSQPAPPGQGLPNNLDPGQIQKYIDTLLLIVGNIFSWGILLPSSVIISGKFISQVVPLTAERQVFKIPLYIFHAEANNSEVIYGFASFILTLVIVIVLGGPDFYHWIVPRLGFDLGQFRTLC